MKMVIQPEEYIFAYIKSSSNVFSFSLQKLLLRIPNNRNYKTVVCRILTDVM